MEQCMKELTPGDVLRVTKTVKSLARSLRNEGITTAWWNESAPGDTRFAHGYMVGVAVHNHLLLAGPHRPRPEVSALEKAAPIA